MSCTVAIRGSMFGSQPIRPHSFTYQGSNVSFHRALMSRMETAPSEKSQPKSHLIWGRYLFTYRDPFEDDSFGGTSLSSLPPSRSVRT